MKALVTGGAGFIGSNLALELESKGFEVTILDNFSTGNFNNLIGFGGEVVADNILDVDLNQFKGFDVFFHEAAITDTTVTDQTIMLKTNTTGFKKVLDFAASNGIKFIYASSAAVYGDSPSPQKEDSKPCPKNIYAFSKLISDNIAKGCMKKYKSSIVGLRYFNVFGPKEKFKGKMSSMVWQLSQQILSGKTPKVFKYGDQKRDQVYVRDIVNANMLAIKSKENCIVNIGSGKATSFNQIIKALNKTLKTNLDPEYFDNPYTDFYQEFTQADISNAKRFFGYKPKWTFEEAVADYMKTEGFSK